MATCSPQAIASTPIANCPHTLLRGIMLNVFIQVAVSFLLAGNNDWQFCCNNGVFVRVAPRLRHNSLQARWPNKCSKCGQERRSMAISPQCLLGTCQPTRTRPGTHDYSLPSTRVLARSPWLRNLRPSSPALTKVG